LADHERGQSRIREYRRLALMNDFDVVVVGAGVAGLTAAAAAAGRGLKTAVIENLAAGGQVATVDIVRNYPGFPQGVAGYELGPLLQQQAEERGVSFVFDTATAVEPDGDHYRVVCTEQAVTAPVVIIAAGSRRRTLGVPGELEFEGRGVSHCASCDGQFFKGQSAVIVGGGDSAFDEALVLAQHAAEVTIFHKNDQPVAQRDAIERIAALANVRIVGGAEPVAIEGGQGVTAITIRTAKGTETRPCAGIFVYIGSEPNSNFLDGLVQTNEAGRIVTDSMMRASRPGLFAAGDIRANAVGLLASAAGDGATAAVAAAQYLSSRPDTGKTI
jgi:thioredoxin reductase (NADPH)